MIVIIIECANCGKEFNRKPSYVEKINNPTCCSKCKSEMSIKVVIQELEIKNNIDKLEEWVKRKYEVENMSVRKLCELLGTKSNRTILKLLKYFNIEVKHGGEAIKTQWVNNNARKKETSQRAKVILNSKKSRNNLKKVMRTDEYRAKARKSKLGENNPMYNPNLSEEQRSLNHKDKRDDKYAFWRRRVYEKDLFTCQITGEKSKGNIVAHHLDGYDWCEEKRFDISNGTTLRTDIHKLFHKFYGYGGNTEEQFKEFKAKYKNGEIALT